MQLEAETKSQSRIKESDFLLQICKAWDYVNIRSKVIATLFAVWSLLLDLLLNRNCCKGTETTKRLLKLYKIFFLNYIDLIQSIVSIDLKKEMFWPLCFRQQWSVIFWSRNPSLKMRSENPDWVMNGTMLKDAEALQNGKLLTFFDNKTKYFRLLLYLTDTDRQSDINPTRC